MHKHAFSHTETTESRCSDLCGAGGGGAAVQALVQIASLKVAGDKEAAAAEAEWRQLTHLIEHDRKQKVRPLPRQSQSIRF